MKVLLTYLTEEQTIKIDLPFLPHYDSRIYLSDSDFKKVEKLLIDVQNKILKIKSSPTEKEMTAGMIIENSTVQYIDIAWDEEENAYLPLIFMSQYLDNDIDDFDDEDTDYEEKPQNKKHQHGKKKNLFN